jgi:hypothetical protein
MKKCLTLLVVLGLASTACTPRIYVIDRHTIMEDEAAGEWPKFEKELLDKSAATGPTPFPKTASGPGEQRVYNVLNGEMVNR